MNLKREIEILDFNFNDNKLFKIETYTEKSKSTIKSNIVSTAIKITYIPTGQFIIVDSKKSQFQSAQMAKKFISSLIFKTYEKLS